VRKSVIEPEEVSHERIIKQVNCQYREPSMFNAALATQREDEIMQCMALSVVFGIALAAILARASLGTVTANPSGLVHGSYQLLVRLH
jgi:hypothetical protein